MLKKKTPCLYDVKNQCKNKSKKKTLGFQQCENKYKKNKGKDTWFVRM